MHDFDIPKLLAMLSPAARERLAAVATRRSYYDGQIVHERGDTGWAMGIVVSGGITLHRINRDGTAAMAANVVPGQCFGDAPTMARSQRTHRATAIGPTLVDHYTNRAFAAILSDQPEVVRARYAITAKRLTMAMEVLNEHRLFPTQTRIAKALLRIVPAGSGEGRINLLQEELAHFLGLSTVSTAKHLKALVGLGLIETGYRSIRVPDRQRLIDWLAEQGAD